MPAIFDRMLVDQLVASFPRGPAWRVWNCSDSIRENGAHLSARWDSLEQLDQKGGVYVFTLPALWFHKPRTIQLHAPHSHAGEKIAFEFTVAPTPDLGGWGVIYVGRTIDLKRRFRGHLARGERKDGGQVKYGLLDCGLCKDDPDEALRLLRDKGRIHYTVLTGPDHCANRDILEMSLCAKLAPPFNIKSER